MTGSGADFSENEMTNLQTISPKRAAELIKDGAILVDIREADEHARERISGARHRPLIWSCHGSVFA